MLNKKQKSILILGLVVVAFSVLFPSWQLIAPAGFAGAESSFVHDSKGPIFIFTPPASYIGIRYTIDYKLMVIQICSSLIISAGLIFLLTDRKRHL